MTPNQLAKSGTEHVHQRALFAWANMATMLGIEAANDDKVYEGKGIHSLALYAADYSKGIPQLKWLHAIHNQGHGDAIRGAKAKAEGVKAGIWDIFLPVSTWDQHEQTRGYCGLYIEMKVGKNTLTAEQSEFGQYAIQQGYQIVVCWNWMTARDAILKYLGLV